MQLERSRAEFERRGVRLAAISFDSVHLLRHFVERTGIQYPLLSDPKSEVIRAFNVLNDTVPRSHQFYGIPHPGQFLIDQNGIVTAKFFEDKYSDRYTGGLLLVRALGAETGSPRTQKETDHLQLTTWASDEKVHGGNRITLALEVALKPKMHVYAPGVEGYLPIEWKMGETSGLTFYPPTYPESELLHLPAIDEIVPVYQGRFRLLADVLLGPSKDLTQLGSGERELVLKGALRYQACDDKVCYLPQTVPLEWEFELEADDRTRVPEDLRRQGRSRE